MIIYNLFCELEKPICISEKLGLYLINPKKRDHFYGTVKLILNRNLSQKKQHYKKYRKKEYDLKSILLSPYWNESFNINVESTEKQCINELIKKIVILVQVNAPGTIYEDFDEKRLHSYQIDEYAIEHKISMLQSWIPHIGVEKRACVIYDSQQDGLFSEGELLNILSSLEFTTKRSCFLIGKEGDGSLDEDSAKILNEIESFGKLLDNYIEEEADFYKLDFIMDHMVEQTSHYQRFLSQMYIIEMLLVNSGTGIKEQVENKIKYFYTGSNEEIIKNIEAFGSCVYEIRSKLVHGYFKKFEKELKKYKNKFMKNFWFDYFEFTENHWILDHAGFELEIVSKNLVKALLENKNELMKFKNDDNTSIYFHIQND